MKPNIPYIMKRSNRYQRLVVFKTIFSEVKKRTKVAKAQARKLVGSTQEK